LLINDIVMGNNNPGSFRVGQFDLFQVLAIFLTSIPLRTILIITTLSKCDDMKQNDKSQMDIDNKSGDAMNMEDNDSRVVDVQEPAPDELSKLKAEIQELKDKYLRQVAEFDNYRKRTARESLELRHTAGKDVIVSLLDVLDDCDRAEKQLHVSDDIGTIKEGIQLIFQKLRNSLQAKGVKPMSSIGNRFDPDQHEAITEVPVPSEELKGKVIDEVEKGYYLNDKIIRFAKVVVGK
jgi:molecular chaperone GrpE